MLVAGDGWQHAGAVRPIKTTTFADDTLIHHAGAASVKDRLLDGEAAPALLTDAPVREKVAG